MSTNDPHRDEISRRRFLQANGALALAAGLGLPGLISSAYSQDVKGKGPPQRGGILTHSMGGDPPNFDTLSNTTGRVIQVVGPCCNGLVRYDEYDPDRVIPDLAESYSMAADGKAYTFKLRKGVKFHDGKPLTSADVKYTFDTLRDPPKGMVSIRANLLDAVAGIEALDEHTVTFVLKRRSPSLIANLAGGWMVVLPKHVLEKGPMKDTLMGTGPFKLKEYKRGVSIELMRNPEYFNPGKPYLDGIKIFFIPDANTAFGYFRTGQMDVVDVAAHLARERQAELAGKAYLLGGFSTSSISLLINAQQKPWNDVRVRQAAMLAINREEHLRTLFKGEGVVGGFSLPGPWALPKAEVDKIPGYGPWKPGNIPEAKKLLAEAGFPNGFKDTLLCRRIGLFEPHAVFTKDQLGKVGIDVTLDLQETATYNETRKNRNFKLDAGGRSFNINDPDAVYGDTVTCDGALNFGKLCDPKIEDLFMRQSQETDPAKRVALVNELERAALSQYGSLMLYFRNQFRLHQNRVHGWALHPNNDNDTRFEDCWKEKA